MWLQIFYKNKPLQYVLNEYGDIVSLQKVKFLKPRKYEFDKDGYKRVSLRVGKKNKKFFVHRLVGMMFCEGFSDDKVVNHKDGNKQNNYYKNLEWVSSKENEQHAKDNFLKANGEDNSRCIHSDVEVHHICKLLEKGWTIGDVAYAMGLPYRYVYYIYHGSIRKKISRLYDIPPSSTTITNQNTVKKVAYVYCSDDVSSLKRGET